MKPSRLTACLAAMLAGGSALLVSTQAQAGGLYFSDRGVRPMGRAGAFVAGADDLGATWYNPAGIADAGTAILLDASWLRFSIDYTRELVIRDADGVYKHVSSPNVHGSSPVLPLPTMVGSYAFGKNDMFTVAAGVLAPYVALASYPSMVSGQPSPSRYTLGSFNGSALAIPGVWAAWKPIEEVRVGLGVMALAGVFQSTVTFSASPQDRLIGSPEQPEYDADAQMRVGPIFAPTASFGATFIPFPWLRVGLSGQLPMVVSASGTFDVKLPSAAVFDTARVVGRDIHVRFVLPAVARLGVEVRPIPSLRVEGTYVREFWDEHKSIDATPNGVSINDVTGLPPSLAMPTISIPRNFTDSHSFRLGAEYTHSFGEYKLDFRAGFAYETTAVPKEYLSLSSLDFDKAILGIGGGFHLGQRWRFDVVYAHLFVSTARVSPEEAKIGRINPIKGNAPFESVNGGTYDATADILGIGMNVKF